MVSYLFFGTEVFIINPAGKYYELEQNVRYSRCPKEDPGSF